MSDDLRARYAQAIDALNRGAWQQAASISGGLLPLAPSHGGVHFVAGVAALQLNQLKQALSLLQRACKLSPNRADHAAQFARALSSARLIGGAVRVATTGLALPTDDSLTLDTLGVVLSQGHAHVAAADAFARAVALLPAQASYRFNLATSLLYAGQLDAPSARTWPAWPWSRVPGRRISPLRSCARRRRRRTTSRCSNRMAFEKNAAPVSTASVVQVREPLNRKSLGRWRQYETELQPMRELLEEAGIAV